MLYLHACKQQLQPRNNSPTLLNRLSAHVNRTASPDMFRVLGEVGLSFTQLKALFLLHEHGELTVKDIAVAPRHVGRRDVARGRRASSSAASSRGASARTTAARARSPCSPRAAKCSTA